jgi:flagellar hook-associated protein FlgK
MRIDGTAAAGLWANQALFTQAAHRIANVNTPPEPGEDPVELTEEVPAMIVAEHGYTASARVLRVQDETSRSLIDVLG